MGCGSSRDISFIANCTPFYLRIQIFQDENRITEREVRKEVHAEAGVDGGAFGSVKAGGSYENNEKGFTKYVDSDFEGFIKVGPDSCIEVPVSQEINYLTLRVTSKNSSGEELGFELCTKFKMVGRTIRYIVGILESEKYEFDTTKIVLVKAVDDPNIVKRAKDKLSSQNYFYKEKCEICEGRVACREDCPNLKKYKGHETWSLLRKSHPSDNSDSPKGRLCPNGHVTTLINKDNLGLSTQQSFFCDECRAVCHTNFACLPCNFNLCLKCNAKK